MAERPNQATCAASSGPMAASSSSSSAAVGAPALWCDAVSRTFGERVAVRDLSFHIQPGEAYGLLGPNGAGKSTMIRMVCGLLDADQGSISILGIDMHGRGATGARRLMGYVPQQLAIFPMLSLTENLLFWARLGGIPRRQRACRVEEVLQMVGLAGRAADRADQTSGGMQRRLNLGVALLHEPKVLVLDEPTVGVDAQSRAALITTIGTLRDQGVAVLYTSHYFDEVERLCDRVGVIDAGTLVVEGTVDELLGRGGGAADLEELFLDLTGRDLRE
ncbi:MAG: ABC transporter ATP-binding protein [Aquihabitans sp.]